MKTYDDAPEILLVEDNPNDVELLLRALKKHRITNRVNVAKDGVEALEFLRSIGKDAEGGGKIVAPRVILLDLKLPRMSGTEVLSQIKADPVLRKIPVVVLTSSQEESDLAATYGLNANSYIVKPVDFERFLDIARHIGIYWLMVNEPPVFD